MTKPSPHLRVVAASAAPAAKLTQDGAVAPQALTSTTKEKLKQFVARIEKLEEEKAAHANDIKETYAEAKSIGFDAKALRAVVKFRKQDARERDEQEQIRELYLHALGEI